VRQGQLERFTEKFMIHPPKFRQPKFRQGIVGDDLKSGEADDPDAGRVSFVFWRISRQRGVKRRHSSLLGTDVCPVPPHNFPSRRYAAGSKGQRPYFHLRMLISFNASLRVSSEIFCSSRSIEESSLNIIKKISRKAVRMTAFIFPFNPTHRPASW